MERARIDELFEQGEIEQLTQMLEEFEKDYEEYPMYKLGQCYYMSGNVDGAKKILRKLKRLFPNGEFNNEENELLELINNGVAYSATTNVIEEKTEAKKVQNTEIILNEIMPLENKKKKKETVIAQTVETHFEDIVGLENVQEILTSFFNILQLQNQRKEMDFMPDLIKSTHFVISGAPGCGKTMVGEIIAKMLFEWGVRENEDPIYVEASELLVVFEKDKMNGIGLFFAGISEQTIILENVQALFDCENAEMASRKALLACLEKVLKGRKDEISVILTGTNQSIEKMRTLNNTIEDAFFKCIEITKYSVTELVQIAEKLAKKKALHIHDTSKDGLAKKIGLECKKPEFMNAISINRYLEEAASRMATRIAGKEDITESDMVCLMKEDFAMELDSERIKELLEELDKLIGLQSVKKQIKKRIQGVDAEQKAQEVGASRKGGQGSLHMLFTGNPGTGKTTVARMIGEIYQAMGILANGSNYVECSRSELVAQYVGQTAKNVTEYFQKAQGGVLFIDEAYALYNGDRDTFGKEAVDQIILEMENNKDSMVVILAGYKKEMENFLKTNPGFDSRIRNRIEFEDYTVEEMEKIFRGIVKKNNMQLNRGVDDALYQMIEVRSKSPNFGNGRGVRNLYEEVMEAMNDRLHIMREKGNLITANDYDIICKEDIEAVLGMQAKGEETLEELLARLNNLTGLSSVKQKVQEMVDDVQVRNLMKSRGQETNQQGTLHLAFKGNAGTGKTTVARLLGQIYMKLGILKKNVFISVSRENLVGKYQGHTATNVLEYLNKAEGGILFIDEVYTLKNGEHDSYGKEAINTLVAQIEDRRDSLMVIVAGYGDKMKAFFDENQGLASRISNEIVFEDYTEDEMVDIFCQIAKEKNLLLAEGIEEVIKQKITEKLQSVENFGNARGVRNMLESAERRKNSRIAQKVRRGENVTDDELRMLIAEDIE